MRNSMFFGHVRVARCFSGADLSSITGRMQIPGLVACFIYPAALLLTLQLMLRQLVRCDIKAEGGRDGARTFPHLVADERLEDIGVLSFSPSRFR
jgi:hypothetical protein